MRRRSSSDWKRTCFPVHTLVPRDAPTSRRSHRPWCRPSGSRCTRARPRRRGVCGGAGEREGLVDGAGLVAGGSQRGRVSASDVKGCRHMDDMGLVHAGVDGAGGWCAHEEPLSERRRRIRPCPVRRRFLPRHAQHTVKVADVPAHAIEEYAGVESGNRVAEHRISWPWLLDIGGMTTYSGRRTNRRCTRGGMP